MYDQPPPYVGIYKDQQANKFDARQRINQVNVNQGFHNPDDPSKVYVPSAPPAVSFIYDYKRFFFKLFINVFFVLFKSEAPPSYQDTVNKKKD